jgi:hypothetical protein
MQRVTVLCRVKPTQLPLVCVAAFKTKVAVSAKEVEPTTLRNALKNTEEGLSMFEFDQVFCEETQEEIYCKSFKGLAEGLFAGVSACVLAFGPSRCAKSFTLRGKTEGNRGLLIRAAGELLSSLQSKPTDFELRASAYAVHNDTVHDLSKLHSVAVQELPDTSILQGLSEQQILEVADLTDLLKRAIKVRKVLSIDAHFKDKLHQVVSLQLYRAGQSLAKVDFVELAGSENASPDQRVLKANRVTDEEKRSIAKSFNALTAILSRGEAVWSEAKLTQCLKSTLKGVHVWLVVCVSPDKSLYKHSLAALRFASKLRDSKVDDRVHFEQQVLGDLRQLRQDLNDPVLEGFDSALNWITIKETQMRRVQYSLSSIAAQGAIHLNLSECFVEVDIMKKQLLKLKQTYSLDFTQRPDIMVDTAYTQRPMDRHKALENELERAHRQVSELSSRLEQTERASAKQMNTLQDGSLKYRELVNRLDNSVQQVAMASRREADLETQLKELERQLSLERVEHRRQLQALQGAL